MNFFTRLFKIGQAETNSILNHLEEPINLTEESISDLKAELKKSLEVIAEIKALSIHAKNEAEKFENKSTDYERKAIFILQKGQQKALSLLEADKLATEALQKKATQLELSKQAEENHKNFENKITQLSKNIATLKSTISKWENELNILRARIKIGTATKNLNKQLALLDSNSTITLLSEMREKIIQEEALAKSYQEIAEVNSPISLDSNLKAGDIQEDLNTLKQRISINETK
jgi:phage shock protein A|tara:strand:+ start:2324 stop:3022 length:699 start_codon:yes stop_codon:yes gene_type:complete